MYNYNAKVSVLADNIKKICMITVYLKLHFVSKTSFLMTNWKLLFVNILNVQNYYLCTTQLGNDFFKSNYIYNLKKCMKDSLLFNVSVMMNRKSALEKRVR